MLNRLPRQLPTLEMMIEDIGNPSSTAIARALCVHEETVRKWRRQGHAPHPAMLALFWITRWGMSAVDCEAHNAAVMSAGLARSRLRRIDELEGSIQRLGRIAHFGSANDPAPGVVPVASMLASGSTITTRPEQPSKKAGSTDATKPSSTQQPCGLQKS